MAYNMLWSRVFIYLCMLIISYILVHLSYLSTPTILLHSFLISFPNNNSSNFALGPISLMSISSECFLSRLLQIGSQFGAKTLKKTLGWLRQSLTHDQCCRIFKLIFILWEIKYLEPLKYLMAQITLKAGGLLIGPKGLGHQLIT